MTFADIEQGKIIIIGVGQEFRGDDAAGLLTARRLKEEPGCRAQVLENSGDLAGLLEAWRIADAVIVVDALRGGGRAGAIHRFPVHETGLPAAFSTAASSHAWGLAEAVALGRTLGQLPPCLVIYGIEGRKFGIGQAPSPAVTRAITEAARLIMKEIEDFFR